MRYFKVSYNLEHEKSKPNFCKKNDKKILYKYFKGCAQLFKIKIIVINKGNE